MNRRVNTFDHQTVPERSPLAYRPLTRRLGIPLGLALAILAGACSATIVKHGNYFKDTDLQQIQPGMTQEQVRLALGTPATTASVGTGNVYYYISNTTSQSAFFAPEEIDRRVAAVYFTRTAQVERVAEYGLKDGKVFDFISRTTPSANNNDEGILKSLFRNLGKRGSIFGD